MTETASYAVSWSDAGCTFVGYARLTPDGLRLAGAGPGGREQMRTLRYGEIGGVDVVRSTRRRELALNHRGSSVLITSLDRPGSLGELADRLRARTS